MEQLAQMTQAMTGNDFLKNAGSEPLDDAAYTQQQVQWYNESPGKLTGTRAASPFCRTATLPCRHAPA